MVGAGSSSVFQSLQPFSKGGLWVRQPGARQDPSFSRHYGYPPCDLRCQCRLLPSPPTDLVSCRHRSGDSGCPVFWTCEMHRWQLSTGNTGGLVCKQECEGRACSISVGLFILWDQLRCWGCFMVGVCLIFLAFFTLWAWQGRDSGQLTSHLYAVSPQIVPRWLGAFLSPVPGGLCFWDQSGSPPAPPVGAFLLRNALKLLLDLKRLVLAEGLTDWLLKWCVSILLLAVPKLGLAPDCNLYCYWVFYCWGYVFL